MPLSWNEIRSRALRFSQEYADATRENAETHSFYNDFFNIFGISRRRVASFEEPVKRLGDRHGRIDLFWKGTLLVEQKSAGRDLDVAYSQALDYFPTLKEEELPRYILVSDFQRFELFDLESNATHGFRLDELHQHVELFGFIAGYQKREFKDQDPVNIEASERMGKLHDMLREVGYGGHALELLLVRLLFCLFADDTGIFEKDILRDFLEERTREDGSDLGLYLAMLFQILDTPHEHRHSILDDALTQFPYVNGSLFADSLPIPSCNRAMRDTLISACYFDWGRISPAIFGSLFQSVMDKEKRRGIGAHYTTEKNIMKIVKPLFLDGLWAELERARTPRALDSLHDKLATLTFLDPACGCGNFLILAYRELRLLEIELLKRKYPSGQLTLDVGELSRIDVDAFYGIEIEEFPARIAEVALWLMDHQMNMLLSQAFGLYYVRIPLQSAAHIVHGNALTLAWESVVPRDKLTHILGNPPFVGKKEQTRTQKAELMQVFTGVSGAGVLDYVTAWYIKAAQYIQETSIRCAFVSTNSITQGEQVGILWNELFGRYRVKIHFAHRTFAWGSEARGKAAVHCVIVGFATYDADRKSLFDYESPKSEAHEIIVRNINPYLVEGEDFVLLKRRAPICNVPPMNYGSIAIDNGHLILSEDEKTEILMHEPGAAPWIRQYVGSEEFLNNIRRYCLWLDGINPSVLRNLPRVRSRVEATRGFRLSSNRRETNVLAATPYLFGENRQPSTAYLLVPKVSSETRRYLPIGYCTPDMIANGSSLVIPDANFYEFGVLSSIMHNDWMRHVGGRLESRYQYSSSIVYNNYPWPEPTVGQVVAIEEAAQAVLAARAAYPHSTLADLYDPNTMPDVLARAHRSLDRAVDAAYRRAPFDSERARLEFLFDRYRGLTAPLIAAPPTRRRRG